MKKREEFDKLIRLHADEYADLMMKYSPVSNYFKNEDNNFADYFDLKKIISTTYETGAHTAQDLLDIDTQERKQIIVKGVKETMTAAFSVAAIVIGIISIILSIVLR